MKRFITVGVIFFCAILTLNASELSISVGGPQVEKRLVFSPGNITVEVDIAGVESDCKLTALLVPYGRKDIASVKTSCPAKSRNKLQFDMAKPGYYTLELRIKKDGMLLAEKSTNIAVVPAAEYDRPRELGTTTHFANRTKGAFPLTFLLLRASGFSRLRDDIFWAHMEASPGKYSVPARMDKTVNTALKYGIRPLLIFGYANTKAYSGKFHGKFDGKPFPRTRELIEAYCNAGVVLAKHFKGRVYDYEIWNEPIGVHPAKEYLPLLKEIYPRLKKVDSKINVISCGGAGAGGGPGGEMIIPIIRAGGRNYQDAFSIHPYVAAGTPEKGYKCRGSAIPYVGIPVYTRFLMNTGRAHKPGEHNLELWVTELGWYTGSSKDSVTPDTQAAFAARMLISFRAAKINGGVFWYDFQDDGVNPNNREHNFGLIRKDYSPKPAFQALAVCAFMLKNLPFSKAVSNTDKVKAYVFGNRQREVMAVWTMEPTPVEWKTILPVKHGFDWAGRRFATQFDDNGKAVLKLTSMPQYFILKGK